MKRRQPGLSINPTCEPRLPRRPRLARRPSSITLRKRLAALERKLDRPGITSSPKVEADIVRNAVELALRGDAIMLRYIINRFRLSPPTAE